MVTRNLPKGTKVVANRNLYWGFIDFITKGETYEVKSSQDEVIFLHGKPNSFDIHYFDFPQTPKRLNRDKTGKFICQKTLFKPLGLKRGSIYGVKRKAGRQVARLHSTAKVRGVSYGVFSQHKGKPFLVKSEAISIADKEEVNQYLKSQN